MYSQLAKSSLQLILNTDLRGPEKTLLSYKWLQLQKCGIHQEENNLVILIVVHSVQLFDILGCNEHLGATLGHWSCYRL